ncbi:MAG: hypothetical protein JWQ39_2186 [Glaciihabitans sp.]|nr:hypothetical protein [Glaciihabitans sp.]
MQPMAARALVSRDKEIRPQRDKRIGIQTV